MTTYSYGGKNYSSKAKAKAAAEKDKNKNNKNKNKPKGGSSPSPNAMSAMEKQLKEAQAAVNKIAASRGLTWTGTGYVSNAPKTAPKSTPTYGPVAPTKTTTPTKGVNLSFGSQFPSIGAGWADYGATKEVVGGGAATAQLQTKKTPTATPTATPTSTGGTMGSYYGTPIPAGSTPAQIQAIIQRVDAQRAGGTKGGTTDNAITNAKVDSGKLPKEQREDQPQQDWMKYFESLIQDNYPGQTKDQLSTEQMDQLLQQLANQNPEAADAVMNQLGYTAPPGGTSISGGAQTPALGETDQQNQSQYGLQYSGTPTAPGNPSVVDFMNATGLASDPNSRAVLAEKLGIPNYQGTAEQNTEMLNRLREDYAGQQNIAAGTSSAPSTGNAINLQSTMSMIPRNYTQEMFQQQPVKTLSDYITEVMDALGMGEVSVILEKEADALEEIENERDEELRDVDDNPWLTEGVRLRERDRVEKKYQDEIGNREAKLARLQRNKELMVQQAQWALGTAISLWDSDRRFQAAQADALYQRQQDALEWKYKEMVYDTGIEQFEADMAMKQAALEIDWYNAQTSRMNALDKGNGLDATTVRQLTEGNQAKENLILLLGKYKSLVDNHGYTNEIFGDKVVVGQLDSLWGQITAEYKRAETLGTLDEGVLNLMKQIIGETPTSKWWPFQNVFGGKSTRISTQVGELILNMQNKLNADRARLGLPPMVFEQADTIETAAGNTYILPYTGAGGLNTSYGR